MAESRAGYFVRLHRMLKTLRAHGIALAAMGPLAPPCLVIPYRAMRFIAQAAVKIAHRELIDALPESAREAARGRPSPIMALADSLPPITSYWKNAPKQWQHTPGREDILIPGSVRAVVPWTERRGEGGLRGALEDMEEAVSQGLSVVVPSGKGWEWSPSGVGLAVAQVGGMVIGAAAVIVAGPEAAVAAGIAVGAGVVAVAGASLISSIFGDEPERDTGEATEWALAVFVNEYEPATVQQWRAVTHAKKSSGCNPAMFTAAMTVLDPENESASPFSPDELGPLTTYGTRDPWRRTAPWPGMVIFGAAITVGEIAGG